MQLDPHQQKRNFTFLVLFKELSGLNDPRVHKHPIKPLNHTELVDSCSMLISYTDMVSIKCFVMREANLALFHWVPMLVEQIHLNLT